MVILMAVTAGVVMFKVGTSDNILRRSSSELLLCPFHFTLSSSPGKSISDLPFLTGDPHKCPLCWNLCFACWNRREQEGILLQTVFGTRNVYYVNL